MVLHMTENCPTLVCMGCAMIYVSSLRGERDLCDLYTGHGSDRETILCCRKTLRTRSDPNRLPITKKWATYVYMCNGLCR